MRAAPAPSARASLALLVLLVLRPTVAIAPPPPPPARRSRDRTPKSAAARSEPARHWFTPNQLAANVWYRPAGSVINGHVAGSFTNASLWPGLRAALGRVGGGFGVYAAELAFLSRAQLAGLGVPVQAEDPTWTQCLSAPDIARLALLGRSPPSGPDLLCAVFRLCNASADGRPPADGVGWYVASDGASFAPDAIVLDERAPGLLAKPSPTDPARMAQLFNASLPWPARKAAAFEDPCPAYADFRPGAGRVDGVVADYVDFARALAARFPARPPALALHWNVVAWWEWADEACLDALNAAQPDAAAFRAAFFGLAAPCHRDTAHLAALAAALCGNGTCPAAVYMDVDYTYNTSYAVDVLARNKAALAALGVPFGFNVVDACGAAPDCLIVDTGAALEAVAQPPPFDPNELHERSLLAVHAFFARAGVIDAATRLRVASWSVRPTEAGAAVDERIAGSMAHAAGRVFGAQAVTARPRARRATVVPARIREPAPAKRPLQGSNLQPSHPKCDALSKTPGRRARLIAPNGVSCGRGGAGTYYHNHSRTR